MCGLGKSIILTLEFFFDMRYNLSVKNGMLITPFISTLQHCNAPGEIDKIVDSC